VTNSLALSGAMAVGVALVLIPLAQVDTPARSGVVTAVPVVGGFVLALHPLWADGTVFGSWPRGDHGPGRRARPSSVGADPALPARYLPIGGLAVAFALEVQFGLSIVRAFRSSSCR